MKLVALAILAAVAMVLNGGTLALTLCNVTDDGFTACKPSVTQPNPVPPSTECCSAVSGADFECLCSYRNSFMLPSLGIDPDLAMALPAKCNLTPPRYMFDSVAGYLSHMNILGLLAQEQPQTIISKVKARF